MSSLDRSGWICGSMQRLDVSYMRNQDSNPKPAHSDCIGFSFSSQHAREAMQGLKLAIVFSVHIVVRHVTVFLTCVDIQHSTVSSQQQSEERRCVKCSTLEDAEQITA